MSKVIPMSKVIRAPLRVGAARHAIQGRAATLLCESVHYSYGHWKGKQLQPSSPFQ